MCIPDSGCRGIPPGMQAGAGLQGDDLRGWGGLLYAHLYCRCVGIGDRMAGEGVEVGDGMVDGLGLAVGDGALELWLGCFATPILARNLRSARLPAGANELADFAAKKMLVELRILTTFASPNREFLYRSFGSFCRI